MTPALSRLAEYLILPPSSPLLLIVLGLLLMLYWRRTGWVIAFAGAALLYTASIPLTSYTLMESLRGPFHPLTEVPPDAQAIVVLAGGREYLGEEYGGDVVNRYTLERVRQAAQLQRRTGLPILASGGINYIGAESGAVLMRDALERDFEVPVRWLEEKSGDTYENARYSAQILKENGIDHILLVTQAWHIPRAAWSFAQAGIEVTPAPAAFTTDNSLKLGGSLFVPRYQSLLVTCLALHEYLGLLWYRIQYGKP